MEFFAGIDLGKRKSQIKVLNQDRKVVEELKIDNDPKEFFRIFKKYKGKIDVACEASSNAFWIWDTLSDRAAIFDRPHIQDPLDC